jgi:large subunit ribosomal protein L4
MKLSVVSLENKKVADIDLNDAVFGAPVRIDLMSRMVHWQRNKARSGNHKTKTISEISGTGKKPFAQKGTGNARAGTLRASHHRGGQTVFGPLVRDHSTDLPKKVRAAALRSALSSKAAEGKLVILDEAKAKAMKTKDMASKLEKLKLSNALFVIGGEMDMNFVKSVSNIPHIATLPTIGANVKDILKYDQLVLTQEAVKELEERLA